MNQNTSKKKKKKKKNTQTTPHHTPPPPPSHRKTLSLQEGEKVGMETEDVAAYVCVRSWFDVI
jgi:hypothetical protein